jgi:cysteinyl-tRNA synthetase
VNTKLKLYNTLSRKIEFFEPINAGKIGVYTCGPTVYDYAHIGNLRTYVFADLLRRTLEYFDFEVNHVMNITDVGHLTDDGDFGEDKMELQAKKKGGSAWDLAEYYADAFFRHTKQLNINKPSIVCKATEHIDEQIELIQKLEDGGYTYRTSDAIYFNSTKFEDYGKLAKLKVEGLKEGARVEAGEKRSKTDFALWKLSDKSKKRQMEWDSPWGKGFPGWHLECSAMAMKYLGETFDIHTGGIDHIPVHHTNEIAQSECATGKSPFARFWMHGEFLVLEKEERMGKSLGNFLTLDSLIEKGIEPVQYRFFLINAHYRSKLKFSFKNLEQAVNGFKRLKSNILRFKKSFDDSPLSEVGLKFKEEFERHLANDMDMPNVMANFWNMMTSKKISDSEKYRLALLHDSIMGLGMKDFKKDEVEVPQEIQDLLEMRETFRKSKEWSKADEARIKIEELGYIIEDSAKGASVSRK